MKFLILLSCKSLFHLLDWLIPKNSKLVLFACKSGKGASANIELLYQELARMGQGYQGVLIERQNLWNIWQVLRAKYVFLSHGPGDVIYAWFSRRKIVTYVGHGITLKSFFFTNKLSQGMEKFFQRLEVPGYNYVIASSEVDQATLMQCFAKEREQVLVTGLPRNDLVVRPSVFLKESFPGFTKYILYAPTFRDDQDFCFFPFADADLKALNAWLKERGYLVLLRGHVNNKADFTIGDLGNIQFFNADVMPEIAQVLGEFDVVISDYSSITIDFLLTEKAVMYIPYDKDKYERTRGFAYDYAQVTPGPHVFTQATFTQELTALLSDQSYFREERLRVKKMFHAHHGGAAPRLLRYVVPFTG